MLCLISKSVPVSYMPNEGVWLVLETIWINLHIHFMHRNFYDTVVILDKGNHPHSRRACCNMFVPWDAVKDSHPGIEICAWGLEQNSHQLAAEAARSGAETILRAYGQPLDNSGSFKYPGRILSYTDNYLPADISNLRKERKKCMCSILGKEGSYIRTSTIFLNQSSKPSSSSDQRRG